MKITVSKITPLGTFKSKLSATLVSLGQMAVLALDREGTNIPSSYRCLGLCEENFLLKFELSQECSDCCQYYMEIVSLPHSVFSQCSK